MPGRHVILMERPVKLEIGMSEEIVEVADTSVESVSFRRKGRKRARKQKKKIEETSFLNAKVIDDSVFGEARIIDENKLFVIDQTGVNNELEDENVITVSSTPCPKKKRKKMKKEETIVIDSSESEDSCIEIIDEKENDSVVELSDSEELGICTGVIRTVKRKKSRKKNWTNNYQMLGANNTSDKGAAIGSSYLPSPLNKQKLTGLRPIVIDGSNVAFGHGRDQFSSLGLKICVDYFKQRGHMVKAFIPQFRRRHSSTRDSHLLDEMEKEGVLVYTPSRSVHGRMVVSYDDRFIVEYAHKLNGIIVTRDNFRDVLQENPEWESTIANRLLMFTWVDDMLMFPRDPLGRGGPTLDRFLKF
ncbi:endoribonuclease rege-1-like [Cimex lectularius]|uniref:RNase NYN domain-containing protein n=1 Tax=Cimex lectularius TaxID=79782 RepID=A0A8I6REG7_CIMLE|nr:endoribonuclease rege-1-like [Cimex lectularius]